MLPYRPQPVLHVGPFVWHAFTLLVIAAVVTGFWIFVLRAGHMGLDRRLAWRLYITVILCGFLGAHLFKIALPNPRLLFADPSLLVRRSGIASFGGVIGGVLGALVWLKFHRVSWRNTWRWLDVFAFVFPFLPLRTAGLHAGPRSSRQIE